MRVKILSKLFWILLFIMSLPAGMLLAQVSLLPEHTMTIEGVTVIRDSHNPAKWYYIPEKPTLQERDSKNKNDPKPVFQLVTYQSPENEEYDGGVLQFCVTLNLPENVRQKVEKALKEHPETKGLKDVSLYPLPFNKAEAVMYDASGNKKTEGTHAPSIGPAYITGALPFQLKLDRFGSDLYSALIDKKGSGVGILMNLAFEGVLPPGGFKATINWDQTYRTLKESSDLRISVGNYFVGADVGISKEKIREELISEGCMKVESLTGESISAEQMNRYMDPILEKMQQALIEKIHPPEKIDLSEKSKPNELSKCFFGVRVAESVEIKSESQARKGSETFEFNQALVVERKTACGSFIGINAYSDQVKKRLIQTMPMNSWAKAFLMLPGIENSPELKIQSVNMTANVVDSNGNPVTPALSDTASWAAGDSTTWKNKDGDEVFSLQFPLMSLFDKHNNKIEEIKKEYSFQVVVNIEQKLTKLNTVKVSFSVPMFDGDLPLPPTVDLVDNIVFDASALTFSENGLKKIKMVVKRDKETLEFSLPEKNSDTTSVVFIVPAAAKETEKIEKLMPTITFTSKTKRDIKWNGNEKDLRETDPSLYFMFFDSDWETAD
ncbi:MAG: hypothetical protein ACOYXC_07085 [Candidatus Rifleibacteriota bacterium]